MKIQIISALLAFACIAKCCGAPLEAETPRIAMRLPATAATYQGVVSQPSEVLPPGIDANRPPSTLADLESMAMAGNPAIAAAAARVQAARGQWVQVGLPPNPSAGYVAAEVGDEGKGGQQGGFVGQEFVTGGKLRLNRVVAAQEIQQAEQQLAAMQFRVQTDVRKAYYTALVAQRRAEIAEEIVKLTGGAVKASEGLLQAQEIPTAGLLQTQVEQQNAAVLLYSAQNQLQAAMRQLSAVVGSELAIERLDGDVTELPKLLNWNEELARITSNSPEVSEAIANLSRARATLQRARVEVIPNIDTQMSVQFDNATEDTIAGVQVGMPIPIWNRNQGGIRKAEADLTRAQRNAERVELDLKQRLALAFQVYLNARNQSEVYRTQILPKAAQTYELVQRGYGMGELGYLDLLTAQRTYSQTNLAYLDSLSELWHSWAEIEGLLLSNSLSQSTE